jgi:hypothetical protein
MLRRATANGAAESDAENASLRKQAREGADDAMAALLKLSRDAKSESVKLAAIKELLDRGFGRAASAEPTGAIVAHMVIDDGYEG